MLSGFTLFCFVIHFLTKSLWLKLYSHHFGHDTAAFCASVHHFFQLSCSYMDTTYGIHRNGYFPADLFQKIKSPGWQSLLTVSAVNMPCCKISSPQFLCFQCIFHRMYRTSYYLKILQFIAVFFKNRKRQMDHWMCCSCCHLCISMKNTWHLILAAKLQYFLRKCLIFLLRKIFFPEDQCFWMAMAYPFQLYHKRSVTEVSVGYSDYIFIFIKGTHNHS